MAALSGKLFSHRASKGEVGAVLLQQRCRLPEVQCRDEAGLRVKTLLPVTYRQVEMSEVALDCTLAQRVWSHLGDTVRMLATSCTSTQPCPLLPFSLGVLENRGETTKTSFCNISELHLRILCGSLTAFFASKVEHESKYCNGKGFQRSGSSAFDRVYTAK